MSTFEMIYVPAKGAEPQRIVLPSDRLWEVVERADAKFCEPPTAEDLRRYQRALDRARKGA